MKPVRERFYEIRKVIHPAESSIQGGGRLLDNQSFNLRFGIGDQLLAEGYHVQLTNKSDSFLMSNMYDDHEIIRPHFVDGFIPASSMSTAMWEAVSMEKTDYRLAPSLLIEMVFYTNADYAIMAALLL